MENKALILKALACEPTERTPLWIMRQAGRYLPEYQALRQKAGDFLTLCKTPEFAAAATLQPIQRFKLDAAIIFSDILTIPDALGLELSFIENEGPKFQKKIASSEDIYSLSPLEVESDLGYVMEAIRCAKQILPKNIPLIGFSGTPWTLATYMLEGGSSAHFSAIKRWRYTESETLKTLLTHLTDIIIRYLTAQIQAGADIVMLFDSWASLLTPKDYLQYSLFYNRAIIEALQKQSITSKIPIILFSKNGGQQIDKIAETGCHAIGLDWNADLASVRQLLAKRNCKIAIQGNLDPSALYGSCQQVKAAVLEVLKQAGNVPGHIFNLGHGISKDTPLESVYSMIETVHEYRWEIA